ncbi:Polymerase/histidinol phosphatase-like protein [Podospora appendiculata]|uniref:Histidinol-phosphatase n=1 Tax=Podospora appendiculata TaxID=314037 RepID=A0AAE0X776_9PEZI|nr:Polymerase/histidinol phosphatase-like protein [Podospora appendiculata]
MAFTMHSHSGEFCPGHAKDTLEAVVLHAISTGYRTLGLTEHMPRTELSDLYPDELLPSPAASLASLFPRHEAYLAEAQRLQSLYASQIHILIGFEGEWIRPGCGPLIQRLAAAPCVDYFIGSIHHAAGVPIDYDAATYRVARDVCGGSDEAVFERYYDEQLEMLVALRPKVVGHFDLIRLMSDDPGAEAKAVGNGVWERVVRNLAEVVGYGGWLECNTSALRKGLAEPYPGRAIAEEFLKMGGKFTFSDDSHGTAQVATNYARGLDYLESLGVTELWTLERVVVDDGKATLVEKSVTFDEFRRTLKTP